MDNIVAEWKEKFANEDFKQGAKVEKWLAEDTRESKRKARQLKNGAWKAHLTTLYGPRSRQLAMAFLKCPTAMVDTLLSQWREYNDSPEYKSERDRACKDRTDENKQIEVDAKLKVHFLRHQHRICRKIIRELQEGKLRHVPDHRKDVYTRFLDGRLREEIDDATWKHGYGTLSTGKQIGAFGPRYG